MEVKIIVILIAILGGAYSALLNIVRYRSSGNPIPENVADVYDAETYQKWRAYSGEHSRLDIFSGAFSTLVTVVLLCTDVYATFASLFPSGMFMQLFAVVLFGSVVGFLFGIVFDYIGTMVIEQKYGFNRTTMQTFIIDELRALLVDFGLSLFLSWMMGVIYTAMGDWIILLFAVLVSVIFLMISFLYPILSRVGNKFTPLEDGELKKKLMSLLTDHGYKVKAIEVMDASRRTTKLNAYFTGFGKLKTIVLYDNLVNAMSADEICAVFSHELGHGLHRDVLKQQLMNVGNMLLMSLMIWITVREPLLHTEFGFTEVNFGFAYVLAGIGLGVVQPVTGMLMNAYSRRAEYKADAQSVKEGYGEAMVTALKKLAKENFAHLAPSKLNVIMEDSHPPLSRRIEEVKRLMQSETGTEK